MILLWTATKGILRLFSFFYSNIFVLQLTLILFYLLRLINRAFASYINSDLLILRRYLTLFYMFRSRKLFTFDHSNNVSYSYLALEALYIFKAFSIVVLKLYPFYFIIIFFLITIKINKKKYS